MLVSVHIPKTAGSSFLAGLRDRFGEGLLPDYGDAPISGSLPARWLRLRNRVKVRPDAVQSSSRSGGLAQVPVFLGPRASLPADGVRSTPHPSLARAGSPRSQEGSPRPRVAMGLR